MFNSFSGNTLRSTSHTNNLEGDVASRIVEGLNGTGMYVLNQTANPVPVYTIDNRRLEARKILKETDFVAPLGVNDFKLSEEQGEFLKFSCYRTTDPGVDIQFSLHDCSETSLINESNELFSGIVGEKHVFEDFNWGLAFTSGVCVRFIHDPAQSLGLTRINLIWRFGSVVDNTDILKQIQGDLTIVKDLVGDTYEVLQPQ